MYVRKSTGEPCRKQKCQAQENGKYKMDLGERGAGAAVLCLVRHRGNRESSSCSYEE